MADKKDESSPDLDALAGGWQAPWEEGEPKSDEPDLSKLVDWQAVSAGGAS